MAPARLGTSNDTGLVALSAPNFHPDSHTTKKLVESGTTVQGNVTVRLVALFEATPRSCPAPAPFVMRTNAPRRSLAIICRVELPIVVDDEIVACSSGCSSRRQ